MFRQKSGNRLRNITPGEPVEPTGRLGKPEKIADAVLWLCIPQASFVHRHALLIDDGLTTH